MMSNTQSNSIDDLFALSRQTEPSLSDENFTKSVVNQLQPRRVRVNKKRLSFDAIGLLIGALAAVLLVDINSIVSSTSQQSVAAYSQLVDGVTIATAVAPDSIGISLWAIVSAGVGLTVFAWMAWAMVEKSIFRREFV
ncbi:MAG: hypothetical protein AAF197_09500 [Pseudomonadota bacterium]